MATEIRDFLQSDNYPQSHPNCEPSFLFSDTPYLAPVECSFDMADLVNILVPYACSGSGGPAWIDPDGAEWITPDGDTWTAPE